jgi:hypothetical protein
MQAAGLKIPETLLKIT